MSACFRELLKHRPRRQARIKARLNNHLHSALRR